MNMNKKKNPFYKKMNSRDIKKIKPRTKVTLV